MFVLSRLSANLFIIQFAFEIMNICCINYFYIKFILIDDNNNNNNDNNNDDFLFAVQDL